jgi:hypothetical protein
MRDKVIGLLKLTWLRIIYMDVVNAGFAGAKNRLNPPYAE